jgi:hypothetical protein
MEILAIVCSAAGHKIFDIKNKVEQLYKNMYRYISKETSYEKFNKKRSHEIVGVRKTKLEQYKDDISKF